MLFLKFKKGKQKDLLIKSLEKAGSERKLEKITGIPKSSLYVYKNEIYNITLKRAKTLVDFLGTNFKFVFNDVERILPSNWRQVKGGLERIKKSKNDGSFEYLKRNLINSLKEWHEEMKLLHPDIYYKSQYERFRKMSLYKFKTLRGEIVRNKLEMEVADTLFDHGIDYKYEPYLRIEHNVYFPDFKIGNVIIECTAWDGEEKAGKLKEKIRKYSSCNYKTFCVVDDKVIKFYKDIKEFIIDIKDIPFHAQVAQISQVEA